MPGTLVRPDVVGRDEAALDLDAQLLEPEARAVRAHADGDEDDVGHEGLGLAAHLDAHGERAVRLRLVARAPWRS